MQLAGEGLLAASKFWREQLQLLQSRSGAMLVRDGSIIRRMSCAVRSLAGVHVLLTKVLHHVWLTQILRPAWPPYAVIDNACCTT